MNTVEELQKDNAPEIAAIIIACRIYFNTAKEDVLTDFLNSNKIDWPLFYNMICAHHIRPIVNKVFSGLKTGTPISAKLQADCKQIAVNNLEHYRELLRLCSLFKEANITAVPYKGCLFGLQFYNDVSLREFSDLDFLIEPGGDNIDAITKLMETQGYTATFHVTEKFKAFYFQHTREFKFIHCTNGQRDFLAEFHTSLNDPVFETSSPVPNEYLFEGMETKMFSGNEIKTLSADKHFIAMLSHHGIREQWTSLKNITDLAQVIKSGAVNWDVIRESGTKYRFNNTLDIGFSLASDLLGVEPGISFNRLITTAWTKRLLAKHLFPTDRTWRYNLLLKFKSKDSLADKIRMVFSHVGHIAKPSILDYNFVKLPKGLFFLYAFIKPVRMWKMRE